jgi:asparagine synthetase B (glutamine-hydrolysing)
MGFVLTWSPGDVEFGLSVAEFPSIGNSVRQVSAVVGSLDSANRGNGLRFALQAGALVVTVGRLASRPCFVHCAPNGQWTLASSLDVLRGACGHAAPNGKSGLSLSREGVAGVALGVGCAVNVPYTNVTRLPSGTEARLRGAALQISNRDLPDVAARDDDIEVLASQLWESVCASVELACVGARQIAVMVGGGLDSSGLLAAALEIAGGRRVIPITCPFAGRGDDRPHMAALAHALGVVPEAVSIGDAVLEFENALLVSGAPYPLLCGGMELATLRRAKTLGADVLLMGMGGDEILGGRVPAVIWNGAPSWLGAPAALRAALAFAMPDSPTAYGRVKTYVANPLLRELLPAGLRAKRLVRHFASNGGIFGAAATSVLEAVFLQRTVETPFATPQSRYMHFAHSRVLDEFGDMRSQLEDQIGIRREDPYLHEPLLAQLAGLPPRKLAHANMHRGLYRVALARKVPRSLAYRTDKAHTDEVFGRYLDEAGAGPKLIELAERPILADYGIVDGAAWLARTKKLVAGPNRATYAYGVAEHWGLYATEAFLRHAASTQ